MANFEDWTGTKLAKNLKISLSRLAEILNSPDKPLKGYDTHGEPWIIEIPEKSRCLFSAGQLQHAQYYDYLLYKIYFPKQDIKAFKDKHPEYKPQEAPYMTPQDESVLYLDKNSENFSNELKIAIKTSMAIYGSDRCSLRNKLHKEEIVKYLSMNYPELTKNAVERISTLVNQKKGGPKTTPGNID